MVVAVDCPLCNSGSRVGFRLCADNETLVLVCEECCFVWMAPEPLTADKAYDPLRPDFKRHFPACTLQPSRWATVDEVLAYGWGSHIRGVEAPSQS